ncbi:putative methylthioribulose-1-phosphate dehydratase [Frankliniella fusca]|uniref:Methylthioribulose-1-phosphate dehydratase n=1 Tax=Frankliniella fusca TaxID=407009 RepID=A0AAE1LHV6_9NEOP|nr:putative methylthioribulose-1-phosphate dehydratase [Frankliniella fusca]
MGDDVEPVVSKNVNPSLQRTYSDGSPLVSSGVSGGSQGSVTLGPSPQIEGTGYKCTVCKNKVLKTKRGFLNHTFLHNIADANKRKPNTSLIVPKVSGLVFTIVKEMTLESILAEEKKDLLTEILNCDVTSPSWVEFCKNISKPVLEAILKQTKLLPTNQYEEVLSSVNSFFCEMENMQQLQSTLSSCLPNQCKESKYLRNVIFRISFRLCEEIQILVLTEMNICPQSIHASNFPTFENTFASEHEKKALHDHFLNLMKAYFVRAHKINTPVYRSRCDCLKRRVFESGDEDCITTEMIFDPLTWKEDKIKLSEVSFDFLVKLESKIQTS